MDLAITYAYTTLAIDAKLVTVETHLSNGLPSFSMVGLAETAVKESKDRVRSALITSQYEFPARRITVNLAPANLPKSGSGFDLAIAISILQASNQLKCHNLDSYEFMAELALTGELRPIPGTLPVVLANSHSGKRLILAEQNAIEACIADNPNVYFAKNLLDVCAHLSQQQALGRIESSPFSEPTTHPLNFADIIGQAHAKRAMELSACGGHSVLMSGPPGSGKTMLASRLPSILPKLTHAQALETAAITSLQNDLPIGAHFRTPPFRSPHHTASAVALVGGGSPPKPGEISLAHNGVLFLDELTEFNRHVLETLREPLESGVIHISRAARQATFPANFQLIAAMNPCPCGHWANPNGFCRCSPEQIQRYRHKLSGPFLDRIDMHLDVPSLPYQMLMRDAVEETSETILSRVETCRERQLVRQNCLNSQLSPKVVEAECHLTKQTTNFLQTAIESLQLSARGFHRLLRIARTIADSEGSNEVTRHHLSEALNFRDKSQSYTR